MQQKIHALEKLLPEAVELFQSRYTLLQIIMEEGIIGRRMLASKLGLSERTIRNEVESLAQSGLVSISNAGIQITKEGEQILSILYLMHHELDEFTRLESLIEEHFNLNKAIIIRGNMDEDSHIKSKFGMALANLLESLLKDHMTIAITGGTTIAKMVSAMPSKIDGYEHMSVIPARGSIGQRAELQAHTIAFELAKKLNASYELLAIPDNLSNQSINLIKGDPQIQKILQIISKTDIIIFGIGNAIKMAKHRKESQEVLKCLEKHQAVAEAFRHYFNQDGEVVYASETIGATPELVKSIPIRIAVVGGSSKAEAICAMKALLEGSYLILDESAARAIIEMYDCKKNKTF